MSDNEEDEIVTGLMKDAAEHDRAAERLEMDARKRRKMADRARFGIEYLRKQQRLNQ